MSSATGVGPLRIFGAPRQYIQGPGALGELGIIAQRRKLSPLVVVDADVQSILGQRLTAGFSAAPPVLPFLGDVTDTSIETLVRECGKVMVPGAGLLLYGIGGGKTLDVTKAVARRLDAEFVSVPTIASNDSPTGRAIAIYGADKRLERIEHIASSPEAVVVDTAIICQAPPRFLAAGIGDAIAKKFEAERAQRDGAMNFFGTPPLGSALVLADACYRVLRRYGAAAMRAAHQHRVTPEFESVVEACLLMSGIAWESGGVSLAHGVVRGIARSPGAQASLHGEHVAYGLLVMHALDSCPDETIIELAAFYREVGLAATLGELGLENVDDRAIAQIARWTFDGPSNGNLIVSTTESEICEAIERVERLVLGR